MFEVPLPRRGPPRYHETDARDYSPARCTSARVRTLATEHSSNPPAPNGRLHTECKLPAGNLLASSRFRMTVKRRYAFCTLARSHARLLAFSALASHRLPRSSPLSRRSSPRQASGYATLRILSPTHLPSLSRLYRATAKSKPRSQCLRLTPQTQHYPLPLLPGRTDEPNGFGRHASRRRERLGDVPRLERAASAYPLTREACERYGSAR